MRAFAAGHGAAPAWGPPRLPTTINYQRNGLSGMAQRSGSSGMASAGWFQRSGLSDVAAAEWHQRSGQITGNRINMAIGGWIGVEIERFQVVGRTRGT